VAGTLRRPTLGALGSAAAGGAIGTALRLAIGVPAVLGVAGPGPLRLLALNVLGAALAGLLVGWLSAGPARAWWVTPFLLTGVLGGMTTFSSMIVAAGRLGHDLGLVAADSARMTGAGLGLAAAYLTLSVLFGLVAFRLGRASTQRTPRPRPPAADRAIDGRGR